MIRRNNVRTLTHQQSGAVHTAAFQAVDLFEKHFRINNNTVADNRSRGRADDAGGQQVQRIRFVADHHGMARIVAAVEAGNIVDLRADQVGRLTLAFVSPLGTDQNNSRHVVAPPRVCDFASKPYQGLTKTILRPLPDICRICTDRPLKLVSSIVFVSYNATHPPCRHTPHALRGACGITLLQRLARAAKLPASLHHACGHGAFRFAPPRTRVVHLLVAHLAIDAYCVSVSMFIFTTP